MQHICHISVLNPALHARIFVRQARSQAALGYRVSVLAQDPAQSSYRLDGVDIHPVEPFHRLSWARWAFARRIRARAAALRADAYVLHSPELLGLGRWLRARLGARILYDVHEDYAATLRAARHYPAGLRQVLAALVRRRERQAARWLAGVSYAEASYGDLLAVGARGILLRNTFAAPGQETSLSLPTEPYLLYTGTLAEDWGVFETIRLWEKLRSLRPLGLVIAGYSPDQQLLQRLAAAMQATSSPAAVRLIGGDTYVPYADIVALQGQALALTGLYRPAPYIQDKIPTKFYEALAAGKPLFFTPTPTWDGFDEQHTLGLGWRNQSAEALWAFLDRWQAKPPVRPPASYAWEEDARRMQGWLQGIWT